MSHATRPGRSALRRTPAKRSAAAIALATTGLLALAAPVQAAPGGAVSTTTTAHNNVQVGREGGPVSSVRVTSTGSDPLTVTGVSLTGAAPDQWRIRTNTCLPAGDASAVLPPAATCTVTVSMLPSTTGAKSAALSVATSAGALTSSTFSGTARDLGFSTSRVDFGSVDVGTTTAARRVTITNRDTSPYPLGLISTGTTFPGVDTCSTPPATGTTRVPVTLQPGASCDVDVTFAPTTLGAKAGTVAMASFSPAGVALVGEPVGRSAGASPAVRTFTQQRVGVPGAPGSIRLRNTGNGPIAVSAVDLVGTDAGAFEIVDDACTGRSVPSGDSCAVAVRLLAAREGWRSAHVRFSSDAVPGVQLARVSGRVGPSILDDGVPGDPFALALQPAVRLLGDGEDGVGGALASGPCDVDGDGHDDVIAGASTWSRRPADLSWEGATYVRFGGADLGTDDLQAPRSAGALRIEGEDTSAWHPGTGSQSGFSVACAGDVNGDGLDDLAIGAWNYATEGRSASTGNVGRAYVVFGARDLRDLDTLDLALLGRRGFRIAAPDQPQYDHLGIAVAGVGDLDGDGLDDVAVGANVAGTEVGTNRSGMAYVVRGRRSTAAVDLSDPSTTLMRINNGIPGPATGTSGQLLTLAGIGDFNGDGTPDVAYGSHTAQAFGSSRSAAGMVVVIDGTARGTVDVAARTGVLLAAGGASASHRIGIGLGAAGDVDGDGLMDLIAGADSTAAASSDAAYVLYGRRTVAASTVDTSALTSADGYRILGAPGSSVGYGVTGVGDVDRDGHDDLLVAGYATNGTRGSAWLLRGVADPTTLPANDASSGLVPANAADTTRYQSLATLPADQGGRIDGSFGGDRFGRAVALVGDAAPDHGTAIAIGSDGALRRGRTGSGEVTVVALPGTAPDPQPETTSETPTTPTPAPMPAPAASTPGLAPGGPVPGAVPARSAVVSSSGSRVLTAHRGRVTLALRRIGGPAGRVRISVRSLRPVRLGNRRRVISATRTARVRIGTGSTSRRLTLSAAARRVLATTRRLTVKVTITPIGGGRTSTRTMTLRREGSR